MIHMTVEIAHILPMSLWHGDIRSVQSYKMNGDGHRWLGLSSSQFTSDVNGNHAVNRSWTDSQSD